MTAGDEHRAAGDPEAVGSVSEEAVKLLGALLDGLGDSAHGVNDHFATGSQDCTFCPICRGVHLLRSTSPEVKAHLGAAAASLVSALGALMTPPAPQPRRGGAPVEHIDLDDESGDEP